MAPPHAVATAAVERVGGEGTMSVPAVVQARQRAALAARISASVVALPFREGDRVAAGAVVARLDDAALTSALQAAQAEARAADADLARMESLLAKGAVTPREADQSRARAAAAGAGVASAKDGIAYAVLRAPFEGTVAARPANVGDVVTAGETVVVIEGSEGFEALAAVDGDLLSHLRVGQTLHAVVDGQPAPLAATVRAVSPSGDPATHRFEMKAELKAATGLRSGLFARVLVPSPAGPPRLLVPTTALFERGGLNGVFVVKNGTVWLRWVAIGATAGASTEVRAGLEVGERVAATPAGLADGQPVTEATAGPE